MGVREVHGADVPSGHAGRQLHLDRPRDPRRSGKDGRGAEDQRADDLRRTPRLADHLPPARDGDTSARAVGEGASARRHVRRGEGPARRRRDGARHERDRVHGPQRRRRRDEAAPARRGRPHRAHAADGVQHVRRTRRRADDERGERAQVVPRAHRQGSRRPRLRLLQPRRRLAGRARRRAQRAPAQREVRRHEAPLRRNARRGPQGRHLLDAVGDVVPVPAGRIVRLAGRPVGRRYVAQDRLARQEIHVRRAGHRPVRGMGLRLLQVRLVDGRKAPSAGFAARVLRWAHRGHRRRAAARHRPRALQRRAVRRGCELHGARQHDAHGVRPHRHLESRFRREEDENR